MDSALYFETTPWQFVIKQIKSGKYGNLIQISLDCSADEGSFSDTILSWKSKCTDLLGAPLSIDEVKCDSAFSLIGTYPNNVIVRIFIFVSRHKTLENFEIITEKALILSKPSANPLAHFDNNQGEYSCASVSQSVPIYLGRRCDQ